MASGQTSKSQSKSDVQFYDGQREALGGIFGPGGTFSQFMSGKPNAGFERQQTQGLEQLKARQAQAGLLNTPLGTRQQSDYLQKTTQAGGDDWLKTLFAFMAPAGQKSDATSRSAGGGVL